MKSYENGHEIFQANSWLNIDKDTMRWPSIGSLRWTHQKIEKELEKQLFWFLKLQMTWLIEQCIIL